MTEYPSFSESPPEMPVEFSTSSTAILSLVAGILGLSFLPFIGSIVALLTGSLAKTEIDESGGMLGGEGLAQAGIILGWVGIGLILLSICAAGSIILSAICAILFALRTTEWGGLLQIVITFL